MFIIFHSKHNGCFSYKHVYNVLPSCFYYRQNQTTKQSLTQTTASFTQCFEVIPFDHQDSCAGNNRTHPLHPTPYSLAPPPSTLLTLSKLSWYRLGECVQICLVRAHVCGTASRARRSTQSVPGVALPRAPYPNCATT